MNDLLSWGILGVAKIARNRVIPAIQTSRNGRVTAIATRNPDQHGDYLDRVHIEHVYDDYDELIQSKYIDAIYIPLPNHLHVPYAIKAVKAGKHVLCEKPISLNADQLLKLIDAQTDTGVVVQEAFMVLSSNSWQQTRQLVRDGAIGQLSTVTGNFSYMNLDPTNVRNIADYGGGALLDIGCYLTLASLYFFEQDPLKAKGFQQIDPVFGVDYQTSGVIQFNTGHALVNCSTQKSPQQSLILEGSKGRIWFLIPFSHPDDQPAEIYLQTGLDFFNMKTKTITIPPFNQFRNHVEQFVDVVQGRQPNSFDLTQSLRNMRLIDELRMV
jgi:predicted dehydrogenase